jgi:hypothetical protein
MDALDAHVLWAKVESFPWCMKSRRQLNTEIKYHSDSLVEDCAVTAYAPQLPPMPHLSPHDEGAREGKPGAAGWKISSEVFGAPASQPQQETIGQFLSRRIAKTWLDSFRLVS